MRIEDSNKAKKQPAEMLYEKLFLEISQYSQEDTCVGVSF